MESLSALGWLAKLRPQGLGDLAQIDPVTGQPAGEIAAANSVTAPALGGLARGMWDVVDYPRKVYQGEAGIMNPATGHASDDAVLWALGQSIGRLPPGYSRPMMIRQNSQQQ